MAIHDIPVNLSYKQADPGGAPNRDLPAARLFQNNLQQRLAQVVAPPAAPTGPGVTQPAPVMLNPSAWPGSPQPAPPALTPYTPPPLPVSPATDPATIFHSAGEKAQQLLNQLTRTLQSLTRPFSKTDLAAWNTTLANISSTLRLQVISPAEQLAINQQADLNPRLNIRYAIGLQTPIDGNLALTGSLTELFRFFQTGNAQYLRPFHSRTDGLSLKGLQQRYQHALEQLTDTRVLNAARGRLKSIEQVLKNHYPSLTLMAIADRSAESQNGFQINQASDRDNGQTYIIGLDLPVKMTDRSTRQVPASLAGPLQTLGTFLIKGGYGWLTANGLHANRSTGVTPEGVVKRYALAQVNPADLGNGTPQTGSTLTQHLNTDVELPPANDPESTVNTTLPFGSEKQTGISFKPGTHDEQDKNNNGLISIRASKPLQIPEPSNTQSNNGPVKASAEDQNNTTSKASDEYKEKEEQQLEHFRDGHLGQYPQQNVNTQFPRLFDSPLDLLGLALIDPAAVKSTLNKAAEIMNKNIALLINEGTKGILDINQLRTAANALNDLHAYIFLGKLQEDGINIFLKEDAMAKNLGNKALYAGLFMRLEYEFLTEFYTGLASKDPSSPFQKLVQNLAILREQDQHPEIYQMLYKKTKATMVEVIEKILRHYYWPNYEEKQEMEDYYKIHIEPTISQGLDTVEKRDDRFWLVQPGKPDTLLTPEQHPQHFPFGRVFQTAIVEIKQDFPALKIREMPNPEQLLSGYVNILKNIHWLQQYQNDSYLNNGFATLNRKTTDKLIEGMFKYLVTNFSASMQSLPGKQYKPTDNYNPGTLSDTDASKLIDFFNTLTDPDHDNATNYGNLSTDLKNKAKLLVYGFIYNMGSAFEDPGANYLKSPSSDEKFFPGISLPALNSKNLTEQYFKEITETWRNQNGTSVYAAVKAAMHKVVDQIINSKAAGWGVDPGQLSHLHQPQQATIIKTNNAEGKIHGTSQLIDLQNDPTKPTNLGNTEGNKNKALKIDIYMLEEMEIDLEPRPDPLAKKLPEWELAIQNLGIQDQNTLNSDRRYQKIYMLAKNKPGKALELNDQDLSSINFKLLQTIGVNFQSATFSFSNLQKTVFSDVNLPYANFHMADLQGANLANANLQKTSLLQTKLQSADLQNANLAQANIVGSNLHGTNFFNANLTDAQLAWSTAPDAVFTNAKLKSADLRNINLQRAKLTGADLSKSNLKKANFNEATLDYATLEGSQLDHATMNRISAYKSILDYATLTHAEITGARLTGARLNNVNLTQANLSHSDLTDATLKNTDLITADLQNTKFDRSKMSGADLRDAIFNDDTSFNAADLSRANLRGVDLNYLAGAKLTDAVTAESNARYTTGNIFTSPFAQVTEQLKINKAVIIYLNGADQDLMEMINDVKSGAPSGLNKKLRDLTGKPVPVISALSPAKLAEHIDADTDVFLINHFNQLENKFRMLTSGTDSDRQRISKLWDYTTFIDIWKEHNVKPQRFWAACCGAALSDQHFVANLSKELGITALGFNDIIYITSEGSFFATKDEDHPSPGVVDLLKYEPGEPAPTRVMRFRY